MKDLALRVKYDGLWRYVNYNLILTKEEMYKVEMSMEDFLLDNNEAQDLYLQLISHRENIEAVAKVKVGMGYGACSEREVIEYREL